MIEDLLLEEISGTNKHLQQKSFTMTLSTFNVVRQIPQETKRRKNISRNLSNNSSQVQEFNVPDVLLNSPSRNKNELKARSLFIVKLGVQNLQFRQRFWNSLQHLASYLPYRLET